MRAGSAITFTFGLLGAAAVALCRRLRIWKPVSPEEHERRRRLKVNERGRIGDATLLEIRDGVFFYSYFVSGAEYTASQDIQPLWHLLPCEPEQLATHTGVKYIPENPANSILLCETWSGLYRVNSRRFGSTPKKALT